MPHVRKNQVPCMIKSRVGKLSWLWDGRVQTEAVLIKPKERCSEFYCLGPHFLLQIQAGTAVAEWFKIAMYSCSK